jgi:Uncharacterised nucleotidyltransferase
MSDGLIGEGLAVEDQLLLQVCRLEITPDGARRTAELIACGPDWPYLLEASIRHAVAPLLKYGFDDIARVVDIDGKVPNAFLRNLDELYEGSARRNARLFDALGEVVEKLRNAGVEVLGLKDVQLAVGVYGDAALRPMGDIDLLVRREDWDKAVSVLPTLGFLPRPGNDVPYTRKYAMAQHFRRAEDEIWIDLQWNVLQREWDLYAEGSFTYDAQDMWRDPSTIGGLDFELKAPALEDMLFHLCLHLEGHRYCELVLFCDIAELLRRNAAEIRWDAFLELGRRYGAESSLYYVLLFVERLLDAPVPSAILDSLAPTFFHGALNAPLFGNLTSFHLALDEIRLKAAPPAEVLNGYERVVRRQAARAAGLDTELGGLITAFLGHGGALAIPGGRRSRRMFPDAALPSFEPVRLLILEQDRPSLEHVLADRGFLAAGEGRAAQTMRLASSDPVLAGDQSSLTLEAVWPSKLALLLVREEDGESNAASALRSVRAHLGATARDDMHETVRLEIYALRAEELVVALAADVGVGQEDRLFRCCSLIDLLRKLPEELDWRLVRELAANYGVADRVSAGLAVASAITDRARESGLDISAPRVFEWARYGPESVSRYPWLRAAYYFALSFAGTEGIKQKLAYLGRALLPGRRGGSVISRIAWDAVRGVTGSIARRPPSIRDFAYWVEPATLKRLSDQSELSGSPTGDAA